MPDYLLEKALIARLRRRTDPPPIVVGLDESGRGPWAGPVVAAAVWLDPARCPKPLVAALDDSKRVPEPRRGELGAGLEDCMARGTAAFALGEATVEEIDRLNVLEASLLAMTRAAAALAERLGRPIAGALVDGNRAPKPGEGLDCAFEPVVGGDRLSVSIAAASILAKVTRDAMMDRLAEHHPGYGWEHNRGYGTPGHRLALARLGASPEHRRSFRPVREILDPSI
ncbi:MAG TPA: ribonuclease HII [Kiloniellales bacterium]|nr:ribonuclease HII [Kiloniellales bacterium]